jgi:hypothetical protein
LRFGCEDELGEYALDVADRYQLAPFLREFEFLQIRRRRDLADPRFTLAEIGFRVAGPYRDRLAFERRVQIAGVPLHLLHEVEFSAAFARKSFFDELLNSSFRNPEKVREIDCPTFRHAHGCLRRLVLIFFHRKTKNSKRSEVLTTISGRRHVVQ